jgi:hypothetical protein
MTAATVACTLLKSPREDVMSGTPETTNTLLLLLVIATSLMPVIVIVAGLVAAAKMKLAIAHLQGLSDQLQNEIRPLIEEARATLHEVQHISASVRRRVDEVDRGVTTIQHKTARLTDNIQHAMTGTLGRVLAILRPLASRRAS